MSIPLRVASAAPRPRRDLPKRHAALRQSGLLARRHRQQGAPAQTVRAEALASRYCPHHSRNMCSLTNPYLVENLLGRWCHRNDDIRLWNGRFRHRQGGIDSKFRPHILGKNGTFIEIPSASYNMFELPDFVHCLDVESSLRVGADHRKRVRVRTGYGVDDHAAGDMTADVVFVRVDHSLNYRWPWQAKGSGSKPYGPSPKCLVIMKRGDLSLPSDNPRASIVNPSDYPGDTSVRYAPPIRRGRNRPTSVPNRRSAAPGQRNVEMMDRRSLHRH